MPIDKFLHLLTSSSLWFSRCDFFEDGWEGRYSDATFATFLRSFKGPEEKIRDFWDWHQRQNQEIQNCLYINCWHINEEESAALWQIYSTFGKSVAVKTTMHRLRDAVADNNLSIQCGRVKYLNYANETMPMENLFTPFMRKRRSFAFENELRMLFWDTDLMANARDNPDTKIPPGKRVPIKLEPLIETIYISPHAQSFLRETIETLVEKFDLKRTKIVQSNLFAAPM